MRTTPRSRRTRRYDTEPVSRTLLRAGVVLAVLGVLGYLSATMYSGIPGRDYRYVDAAVPDPGSLIAHDPVRMGGARVGQVDEVSATGDGRAALRLQLEPDTKLTRDTEILIRANGLLGARFVELKPGRSREELPESAVIEGDEDSLTYGVSEALDVLDRETRGRLGVLIAEGATGVHGQGRPVNDALRIGGDVITPSAELFRYLRESPDANRRLLPSIAAAMRPLDANRVALGRLLRTAADALTPFPDERDAVRASLELAPSTLAAADGGLTAGTTLMRRTTSLLRAVNRTLPPAPAALRETRALLEEAPPPLRATEGLLDAARPAIPALLEITDGLRPVLGPLKGLTDVITPIADEIGPYRCDIENVGVVMRSMTGFGTRAPGGPAGPPMAFRLQVAPAAPLQTLSLADGGTGTTTRESYPEPCKWPSGAYTIAGARGER